MQLQFQTQLICMQALACCPGGILRKCLQPRVPNRILCACCDVDFVLVFRAGALKRQVRRSGSDSFLLRTSTKKDCFEGFKHDEKIEAERQMLDVVKVILELALGFL